MFKLDPRLEQDTILIGEFTLSKVLLMNDARYPWVILVPRIEGVTEIFQLNNEQQKQLMLESSFVSQQISTLVQADKMNVAALGNIVSQLHIHHVARFINDNTWPAPVWGEGEVIQYQRDESMAVCQQLTQAFSPLLQNSNGTIL